MENLIERMWKQNQIVQPSCTEKEIERLRRELPDRLAMPVPERYLDFLRKSQGLIGNGMTVYADRESWNAKSQVVGRSLLIPGIIEYNEGARIDVPTYKDYLIIAYTDMDVHGWDNRRKCYSQMMHGDDRPMKTFDTFDNMIIVALWLGLLPENRPDPWKDECPF